MDLNPPDRGPFPMQMFMRQHSNIPAFALGLLVTLILSAFGVMFWVAAGVGLVAFSIFAVSFSADVEIPLQFVAVFVSSLQLILAAVLAHRFPIREYSSYRIEDLELYLAYAGPAVLAFAIGILLTTAGKPKMAPDQRHPLDLVEMDRELAVMFWIGLAFQLRIVPLPGATGFIGVLIGDLAFVAALISFMLHRPKRTLYLALVFGSVVLRSITGGVFHTFIIWGSVLALFVAHKNRWRFRLVPIIAVGVVSMFALQHIKTLYRAEIWYGKGHGKSALQSFVDISLDVAKDPGVIVKPEVLAHTALRLNQGWIVNKVMENVPTHEPHCGFEILRRQLEAAALPRFLAPNKFKVGGQEYFERFTGHPLRGASMTLGPAGEFYAGFGKRGGILAMGIMGALLGLAFRLFSSRGRMNPVWWAWAPFVLGVAIKAEDTVGNIVNWMIKSGVFMVAVILIAPALRRMMFPTLQFGGTSGKAPAPPEPEPKQ